MTFEEAERLDPPGPIWIRKEPKEEISSEILTVTTDNVVQKTSAIYDSESEKITNEIAHGLCSTCGKPLEEKKFAQCYYGDLVCIGKCLSDFEGRSICRKHVEAKLGTKTEAAVLLAIVFGLNIDEVKKITGLSRKTVRSVKNILIRKEYVEETPLSSLGSSRKITENGKGVLFTLVQTYRNDNDFATFVKRVGFTSVVTGSELK